MEENQASYLREDNDGQTSGTDVYRTAEDGNEPLGLPAEALFYALPYMSLKELLCMEQVCKASRDWVREGGMLWRELHVELPLNKSFTDEILIHLFMRSNGELECLCLVDCFKITERAVEGVVLASPRLTKLFLPGCSGITAEGVVNMLRAHTNQRVPGLSGMELRVRNIAGLMEHHVQSLLDIMGVEKIPRYSLKPRYYDEDYDSLSWSSQRPIDVEVCPKCRNVRMVFDCRRDICREKQECRACLMCTVRCADCGVCFNADDDPEVTVCNDYLCTGCWLSQAPKCSHCNRPACHRHSRTAFEVQETLEGDRITLLCGDCSYSSLNQTDLEYDL